MTSTQNWDGVPWMVGGGAEHTPDVGRVLAFQAFRGQEGIMGVNDLKVSQLGTPGAGVSVAPGACSILARSLGNDYQAYTGRLPQADTADIGSTTAAVRRDLIVARVEDPFESGESWAEPSDVGVGPYIFTRVIPGVAAGVTRLQQVPGHENDSGIALARIDIPVSTSVITNAMITDLRKIALPRRDRRLLSYYVTEDHNLNATDFAEWPGLAHWTVDIPSWATGARVIATWSQVELTIGASRGALRVELGAAASQQTVYDLPASMVGSRSTLTAGGDIAVSSAMRGTTVTAKLTGFRTSPGYTGQLQGDTSTTVFLDIEFYEAAG
jgi:hypothetical protein